MGTDACLATAMNSFEKLAAESKAYARLLQTVGENRVELLAVELQEALHRIVRMIVLILGIAVLGLLLGITLTAALVLGVNASPVTVLLCVSGFYIAVGSIAYWRLTRLLGNLHLIADSIGQLRKDRKCLSN